LEAPIISFKWNNSEDFLHFNSQELELNTNKKTQNIPFTSLVSIKLDAKKKLAPLIIGAVLASLALVNILLEGAGLTMIGVLSIGMLILYFGLSEYWVITIEQYQETNSTWVPKSKCLSFPSTLINIIDYRASKGFFPPFYTNVSRNELASFISDANQQYRLAKPLKYFLTPPKADINNLLLKIDVERLNQTLSFKVDMPYLATGTLQINKDAILNIEL